MSNLNGFEIEKGKQGSNALAGGDSISGLIIEAPLATGLALNTIKSIYNPKDAEALGINSAFDTANSIVCYRHIREFYRMAGEGTKLFIMLVAVDTGLEAIFADADTAPSRKMAIAAKGEIKQIVAAVNPTIAGTILNGLTDDCYNAIPKAQGFAIWAYNNHMPCQTILEGREYAGTAASVADLRAIPNVEATKVSIVIGQDYTYADTLTVVAQKYADVGTALGTVAKAKVNQNIGENQAFNLTDGLKDKWMIPGLSNHVKNIDQTTDLQTLEDKGYIFGLEYVGMAGVRWNNDHTCTPIIVDADGNINEHTIGYGRTFDKAVRLLRSGYLPTVKSVQPIDPKTSKLPAGVVKNFDGIGNTIFSDMVSRGEISYGEANTDPNSDLLVEKSLKVGFKVVPYGYANFIAGSMNLKKSV